MRVLFVGHSGLISGAEKALLDELAVLPSGVEPTLACPEGPLFDAVQEMGIEVHAVRGVSGGLRLRPVHAARFVMEVVAAARDLERVVASVRPDLIHANTLRAGLAAATVKPFSRVPLVLQVHDALPRSTAASAIRFVLRSSADTVLAISRHIAANFAGGGQVRNLRVVHNPLDAKLFDPARMTRVEAREELQLPAAIPVVGVVAQITPWKGQELAIKALPLVLQRYPDARLILVGEAKFVGRGVRYDNIAYLKQLHELVRGLRLERFVEFWGQRSDVATIMRGLDVLLMPSWEEPFGRSAIEAMAMETAVVATDVGGPPEYIEPGVDGILLPPNDVDAWANTITELLDDPAKRIQMGMRASPKVHRLFDRNAYTASVVQVYEQVHQEAASAFEAASSGTPHRPVAPPRRDGRMRVVFVEHGPQLGGGQRSLLELMRILVREHEVTLACPPGPLASTAIALGVTVVAIPESQLTFKLRPTATAEQFVRMLQARRALRRHLRFLQPDVIHANSLRAGLLTSDIRRRVPTVAHCRDLLPRRPAANAARLVVLAGNSRTVAVSGAVASRLAGRNWPKRRITVIYNPVNAERFDPARHDREAIRRELGIRGNPVLGIVAQITPWKGQLRALEVLRRVRTRHPDVELLIVGEAKFVSGPTSYDNQEYERSVHESVAELGLQQSVRFLGEREDVERIMAAIDVLLVPSNEEPFGRSVIEALAMGVPVVATDRGGPAEVIRAGVDGLLLPPHDLGAWGAAVDAMLDGGPRLGSRDYVREHFSPERHGAEIVNLYEREISRRRRDGPWSPLP